MAFTALLTTLWELRDGATAGAGGRTTMFRTLSTRAENCDREQVQEHILSANLSLLSMTLFPLGATSSIASNSVFMFYATQPVDVQFGASGAMLSQVRSLTGSWTFSALFITTGSNSTRVVTGLCGGSAATITVGL